MLWYSKPEQRTFSFGNLHGDFPTMQIDHFFADRKTYSGTIIGYRLLEPLKNNKKSMNIRPKINANLELEKTTKNCLKILIWEGLGPHLGRVWDGDGSLLGALGRLLAVFWTFKVELFSSMSTRGAVCLLFL